MQKNVLNYIAKVLNEGKVRWGVGGSNVLAHYGLVDSRADLDLIIHLDDAEQASELIGSYASPISASTYSPFRTEVFKRYKKDETDIDFMSGFALEHENGVCLYPFDENSIKALVKTDNTLIPLTSLEEWFILYQMIPNKGDKADLIELYWEEKGIEHPKLLKKSLEQPLPDKVKERIRFLL